MKNKKLFAVQNEQLNAKEKTGLLIFGIIALISVAYPFLFKNKTIELYPPNSIASSAPVSPDSTALEESRTTAFTMKKKESEQKKNQSLEERAYFHFDPNFISLEQAKTLGISEKTFKVLQNYKQKIGGITTKEQFSKVYGISSTLYQLLEPWIEIKKDSSLSFIQQKEMPSAENKPKESKPKFTAQTPIQKLDINAAQAEELIQLPNIGPYYANKIIQYRNRLGGFYNLLQLNEIYTIPDSVKVQFQHLFFLHNKTITTFDPSELSLSELAEHPYINFKTAKLIKEYIKQHRGRWQCSDLKPIFEMNQLNYEKIAPYLVHEQDLSSK